MSDKRLVITGGNAYIVDFSKLMLFEPMPMTVDPPKPSFRVFMDHAPKIQCPPYFLVASTFDVGPDPWKFMYLFPLGKRAFVKKAGAA